MRDALEIIAEESNVLFAYPSEILNSSNPSKTSYYYSDLEGLEVFDTGGAPLGQVKSVHNHGASDLLEIKRPNSNATVLLPFTNAAVPTVDLKLGRIVADPPLGIFPEQE